MAATDANTLLEQTKCYACYGLTLEQMLQLGLIRNALLNANPNAIVSAQGLITYATCYACYGLSLFDQFKLALLDQAAQAG
jgi:hypothetical protein